MLEAVRSDAELITATRAGDKHAYGELWGRHQGAATRLARQISNPSNADDLVSESFARVLRAIGTGGGPDGAFRPYLFSTMRRLNIDIGRSYYTRVSLTDDDSDLDVDAFGAAEEVLADNVEASAAWRAWQSLPGSTRTLLWHLIIEEESPAAIAPLLGTTPNGVSSRAVRAKERLRQAFLQQHLNAANLDGCRLARNRFGEHVRGALSARDTTELDAHVDGCAACKAALLEISDLNRTMRVVIAPVVLGGATAMASYLGSSGSAAAGAHHLSLLGKLTSVAHFAGAHLAVVGVAAAVAVTAGIVTVGELTSKSAHAADGRSAASKPVLAGTPPTSSRSSSTTPAAPAPSVTNQAEQPPPGPLPANTPIQLGQSGKTSTPRSKTASSDTSRSAAPNSSATLDVTPMPPTMITTSFTVPAPTVAAGRFTVTVPAPWTITALSTTAPGITCTLDSATSAHCQVWADSPANPYDFSATFSGPGDDHASTMVRTYTELGGRGTIDEAIINP